MTKMNREESQEQLHETSSEQLDIHEEPLEDQLDAEAKVSMALEHGHDAPVWLIPTQQIMTKNELSSGIRGVSVQTV